MMGKSVATIVQVGSLVSAVFYTVLVLLCSWQWSNCSSMRLYVGSATTIGVIGAVVLFGSFVMAAKKARDCCPKLNTATRVGLTVLLLLLVVAFSVFVGKCATEGFQPKIWLRAAHCPTWFSFILAAVFLVSFPVGILALSYLVFCFPSILCRSENNDEYQRSLKSNSQRIPFDIMIVPRQH